MLEKANIGIFDSGFGGLTVMNAIKTLLPNESIMYFADTSNLPYGNKSPEEIIQCSLQSIKFLESQGIKLLVVACHSSSVTSLTLLRERFSFPIISILDAGIKKLTSQKNAKNLAILGTEATINSQIYQQAAHATFPSCKVSAVACPLFVPLIEMGYINNPLITQAAVRRSLSPLKNPTHPIDAVLLACTHYPFLKKPIQQELGMQTPLIDPAQSCAKELEQILMQNNLTSDSKASQDQFYVSKNPKKFQDIGNLFSSFPIDPVLCIQIPSFL